jgi:hypothetical protein
LFGRLDCFDSIRTGAMIYVSHAMNFLVVAHEVEHARAGHCLYANARSGRTVRLNELKPSISELPTETLRFMEHEADVHAAALLGVRILDWLDPLASDWCPFDAPTRFALATFAACLLPLSWQLAEADDADHPKPLTRALTYVSALEAVVHARGPQAETFFTAFKFGLQNIFRLGAEMPSFRSLAEIVDDESHVIERRGYIGADHPLERELASFRFDYAGNRNLRPESRTAGATQPSR